MITEKPPTGCRWKQIFKGKKNAFMPDQIARSLYNRPYHKLPPGKQKHALAYTLCMNHGGDSLACIQARAIAAGECVNTDDCQKRREESERGSQTRNAAPKETSRPAPGRSPVSCP